MIDLPFNTCTEWQEQLVFIVGFPPATITRSFSWRSITDGWSYAGNQMLVCPKCQKIWAYLDFKRPMQAGEEAGCLWPVAAFCEKCPSNGPVPSGSIMISYGFDGENYDLPLLYALPLDLLKREFELHLNHYLTRNEDGIELTRR